MQGVLHPGFLFLHLGLGSRTDVDNRHTAGELRETLLKLFFVVIRGALVDRGLHFPNPALDGFLLAIAVNDRRVVLVDHDTLGLAEVAEHCVLEFEADLFADHLTTCENRDVLQHGLATIPKAGRLDGADLQSAAKLVDDYGCQRLALDILGDDQQRLAGLGNLLQNREQVLHGRDLLVVDENVCLLQHGLHLL